MQVSRLTHETGGELLAARDERAERHRRGELPVDAGQPPVEVACVEVDGGRVLTRQPGHGRGVHGQAWREPKVAALWRMRGPTFEVDPHPELPPAFADAEHVERLVREIGRHGGTAREAPEEPEEEVLVGGVSAEEAGEEPSPGLAETGPTRVFRTCVATMRDVHAFGPLVAAEAHRRGFDRAPRRAFVGDGQACNWTLHRRHFPHYVAVVDFVHVLTYVHAAAGAVTSSLAAHREQAGDWATACWQGRVDEVLVELDRWQGTLGEPPPEPRHDDPREVLRRVRVYLRNNRERMDYPRYRRDGPPVTSSLVESLIKEFNWRLKGTEKSWNDPDGAERMLQVRAALLSHGDPLHHHVRTRPTSPWHPRRGRR